MKRLALILGIFTASLFAIIVKPVHAESFILNEPNQTTQITVGYGYNFDMRLANGHNSGTIENIYMRFGRHSSNDNNYFRINIFLYPNGGGETVYLSDCHNITNDNIENRLFTFATAVPIGTNDQALIRVNSYATEGCANWQYSSLLNVIGHSYGGTHAWNEELGGSGFRMDNETNGISDLSWRPYIVGGSGFAIGDLEITSPANNSSIAIGTQNLSGTCPINGNNRIALTYSGYNFAPNHIDFFDTNCTDHTWSKTITIKKGINSYQVSDVACLDTNRPIPGLTDKFYGCAILEDNLLISQNYYLGVDSQGGTWLLAGTYPPCAHNPLCDTLKASTSWIFRWKYNIPAGINTSDVSFQLSECTGGGWETCTTTIINSTLAVGDPNHRGYVDTEAGAIEVENGTTHYYHLDLVYNSDIKYSVTFATLGDETNNAITPITPGSVDCGSIPYIGSLQWLCNLFIPNSEDMNLVYTELLGDINNKMPFGLFNDIITKFTGIFDTTTEAYNPSLYIHTSIANINAPVFGSTDINNGIKSNNTFFRPWIIWALWIGFFTYCWKRIRNLRLEGNV